ncbi:MAG TPA: SRPBCC family protein [Solirubrobacterales bacterium]|nr:SRPBCC family protein [Solirubrobacterales bacterium]
MPETTESIVKEIHIDATPETLFGFFTEAEKLTRWFCSEATTDPRPGGINHQTHPGENGPYFLRGEFVEVEPPTRVTFTFDFLDQNGEHEPDPGLVEVVLTPASGGTDLRLTHSGIFTGNQRAEDSGGWDFHLANLAKLDFGEAPR